MELKDIIEQSNTTATQKRFWEDCENTVAKMREIPKSFSEEDIKRIKMAFYNEKIALIASELGEATESMRMDRFYRGGEEGIKALTTLAEDENSMYPSTYATHVKDTFEDEIADTFIRICDLCYKMGIDIETFIKLKLEYNKRRNERHGKKF